jgi:predicted RecA/RadA family phage recombinase
MADGVYLRGRDDVRQTAAAALDPGQVTQLPDGRAAVLNAAAGASAGDRVSQTTSGQFTVVKSTGIALLDGGRVFWDHSANAATFRKVNDRDFYLGICVGDAASADTTCVVNFNVEQKTQINLLTDGALSVATGTAAAGGFGLPAIYGGVPGLRLTATSEAQSVDMLSVDRVAVASNPIAEFAIRLGANGSDSTVDFNIGLANGTSTTDADAITESVFFHIDGGSLSILAESDDGTTEVNATSTTVNITAGSAVLNRVEFWIDCRNPDDIQMYIDGVNVLPSSVFKLTAAVGPIGLLAHVEKTTGTATAGPIYIDRATLRTSEQ